MEEWDKRFGELDGFIDDQLRTELDVLKGMMESGVIDKWTYKEKVNELLRSHGLP